MNMSCKYAGAAGRFVRDGGRGGNRQLFRLETGAENEIERQGKKLAFIIDDGLHFGILRVSCDARSRRDWRRQTWPFDVNLSGT
jgi:hypothetical protein